MPVLRSRGRVAAGPGARWPGWSLRRALAIRSTATLRSTSPRPTRPSHDTQAIATTVTTTGGVSHHRISTRPVFHAGPRRSGSTPPSGRFPPLLVAVLEQLVLPNRPLGLTPAPNAPPGGQG